MLNIFLFLRKIFPFFHKKNKEKPIDKPLKEIQIKELPILLKSLQDSEKQKLVGVLNEELLNIKQKIKDLFSLLENIELTPLPQNLQEEEKEKIKKSLEKYVSKIRSFFMELSQRIENFENELNKSFVEKNKTSLNESGQNKDSPKETQREWKLNDILALTNFFEMGLETIMKNLSYEKMLLNNFFKSQLEQLDNSLNSFKDLFFNLKKMYEENEPIFSEINNLLKSVQNFNLHRKQKIDKKQEIQKLIEKYNSSKRLKERVLKRDEELRLLYPEKYEDYKSIRQKIKSYETELSNLSMKILKPLLPLQNELDLFADIYKVKRPFVNSYLTQPLESFINDEGLEIIQVLNKVAQLIDNSTIKTDEIDKKIDLINEAIKQISSLDKNEIIKRTKELKEQIREQKSKIRKNRNFLELDDNYYKLSHAETQFKHIEQLMNDLKKEMESLDLVKELKSIEENINQKIGNLLDENIKIVIDESIERDNKSPFISQ